MEEMFNNCQWLVNELGKDEHELHEDEMKDTFEHDKLQNLLL
jgi:hypothetical protein